MQTINFGFGSTALTFCFKVGNILGLFCTFLGPLGLFFGTLGLFLGSKSDSKTILKPTNVDYQFLFWKYSPIFLFLIRPNFGPFCTFWALRGIFFCPLGLFLESRSGSKTFLEPTNIDYQFLFWKCSSPIFLFFIRTNFGLFCTFWALRGYFWGWGQTQKIFLDLLTQTNNFYFGSIALSCFFETFPGGGELVGGGGWTLRF